MVRYHEIINEEIGEDPETAKAKQLMLDFCPTTDPVNYSVVVGGDVYANGVITFSPQNIFRKLPLTFKSVSNQLIVKNNALSSFERLPDNIEGSLIFIDDQFTSLKGVPRFVTSLHLCRNPLTSLEGLEKSNIQNLYISWDEILPLLRCIGHVTHLTFFPETSKSKIAQEIINRHNKIHVDKQMVDYRNLPQNSADRKPEHYEALSKQANQYKKKALYDCQYELMKAGFKGNAKW
jgi:hypothetical protein